MSAAHVLPDQVEEDVPVLVVVCDGTRVTQDGRPMHLMTRVNDEWVCVCGARRDRYGKDI